MLSNLLIICGNFLLIIPIVLHLEAKYVYNPRDTSKTGSNYEIRNMRLSYPFELRSVLPFVWLRLQKTVLNHNRGQCTGHQKHLVYSMLYPNYWYKFKVNIHKLAYSIIFTFCLDQLQYKWYQHSWIGSFSNFYCVPRYIHNCERSIIINLFKLLFNKSNLLDNRW